MNTFARRGVTFVGTVGGLVLFAVTLHSSNVADVLVRAQRLGVGFLWLLLLAGVRLAARAGAWTACAGDGRHGRRLPFVQALAACTVGEAAGSLTPLGPVASEPAKVLWVCPHLSTAEAAASLAAETVIYSLATVVMLVVGTVLWITIAAPATRIPVTLAVLVAASCLALLARRRRGRHRDLRAATARLETWGRTRPRVKAVANGLHRMVDILRELGRRPAALAVVLGLETVFLLAAIAEVWLTLVLLGVPNVTLTQALMLEYVNRIVTIVFKFVPLRLGIDELASGRMAAVLGGAASAGVMVAVVRKARVLCLGAIGLLILAWRATPSAIRRRCSATM